ncbi:unnamed protein product [Nesidiocoris tenuis]|uniref:Uncharacterized protein n=1 Tax=Nesidiocoris tenuis TaxID=355587 RepID=A0A6H5HTM7_9HEMI|nr:unnamed protein product [Nesidiocoris tenuis]CAB0020316.1 unnamed protein product [Nesidiocoris tenuis]
MAGESLHDGGISSLMSYYSSKPAVTRGIRFDCSVAVSVVYARYVSCLRHQETVHESDDNVGSDASMQRTIFQ